ncbi:MAG: hypothetical protein KatS3mg052_1643 [Candidatus Roseilinea sp.]|nr:MAG: hypothetical protein KatS3mg052_1643 [Candidatus Roseilinea sp.]
MNEDQATAWAIRLIRSRSVLRSLNRNAVSTCGFFNQGRVSNQTYNRSELRA